MNDYIFLNGKIFTVDDRQFEIIWIGGSFGRTLSGRGTIDKQIEKKEFTFTFTCDDRQLLRLKNMFDLKTTISLIDVDGSSCTVIITNSFKPTYNGDNIWSLSLEMKEV